MTALLGATTLPNAQAGDREWATAGKVLTGLFAASVLSDAISGPQYTTTSTSTFYSSPSYSQGPVVVQQPTYVHTQPVVVHQAPVVVHQPTVCAPQPVVVHQPAPVVVHHHAPIVRQPLISLRFGSGYRGHGHYHHGHHGHHGYGHPGRGHGYGRR